MSSSGQVSTQRRILRNMVRSGSIEIELAYVPEQEDGRRRESFGDRADGEGGVRREKPNVFGVRETKAGRQPFRGPASLDRESIPSFYLGGPEGFGLGSLIRGIW